MFAANSISFDSPIKHKDRSSDLTAASEAPEDREFDLILQLGNAQLLKSIGDSCFSPKTEQSEVGPKMNRKAINWILSVCWDRDFPETVLWTAVMIYYAFRAKSALKKKELQKTLSTCLFLSVKYHQVEGTGIEKILEITNRKYSFQQIVEMEEQIINALDFDLAFENYLTEMAFILPSEGKSKPQFFCLVEMLLIKDSQILWKREMSRSLMRLLNGNCKGEENNLRQQLKTLSESKQAQIVVRKYASKIETDEFFKRVFA